MTLPSLRDQNEQNAPDAIAAAVVALDDGATSHYEIAAEGYHIVSVRMLQHGQIMWVALPGADADGTGVVEIPALGTEVTVAFDGGEFEGNPYIVRAYGTADTDAEPGRLLLRASGDVVAKAPLVKLGSALAAQSAVLGDDFYALHAVFINAIRTLAVAINAHAVAIQGIADPTNVATAALTAAINAFDAAADAFLDQVSATLSAKVKVE